MVTKSLKIGSYGLFVREFGSWSIEFVFNILESMNHLAKLLWLCIEIEISLFASLNFSKILVCYRKALNAQTEIL